MPDEVTNALKEHYARKFSEFGATAKGVDWGKDEDVLLRHKMMSGLIINDNYRTSDGQSQPSLLDVGCGYGGFYEYLRSIGLNVSYTGIEVVQQMVDYGKAAYPSATFIEGDFLDKADLRFDYVVCNGILTQKLSTSILDMDRFANNLIRKMFEAANKGLAFNIMSTKVNFMVNNLYYRHPADVLTFCLNELTSKVRLEHSYALFEYTVYLYKV